MIIDQFFRLIELELSESHPNPLQLGKTLLQYELGYSNSQLLLERNRSMTASQVQSCLQYLKQLKRNIPIEYLIGTASFYGYEFKVNSDVLIPRPDTESLIQKILSCKLPNNANILELGTGSGAIAIVLKKQRPLWKVTAVERSQPALEVAQYNAKRHECHIQFIESHWFGKVTGQFHCIVANPPYIAGDSPSLGALHAEPLQALIAENRGLADLHHIVEHSQKYLYKMGRLVLEHSDEQTHNVQILMRSLGFIRVRTIYDLSERKRGTTGICYR